MLLNLQPELDLEEGNMSNMGSNSINQNPHPPAGVGMMNSQQSRMNTTAQAQTANGTIKKEVPASNMADNALQSPAGELTNSLVVNY